MIVTIKELRQGSIFFFNLEVLEPYHHLIYPVPENFSRYIYIEDYWVDLEFQLWDEIPKKNHRTTHPCDVHYMFPMTITVLQFITSFCRLSILKLDVIIVIFSQS